MPRIDTRQGDSIFSSSDSSFTVWRLFPGRREVMGSCSWCG
jgi:hypothetical protein